MRFAGFAKTGVIDQLLTSEQIDQRRRHAWLEFKEAMDRAIVEANRESLRKIKINKDNFVRLAHVTAEARALYLQKGLEIAAAKSPSREQIAALAEAREAFEESCAVFEALERIIERGYLDVPK
jgi:DNA-directed RNA polymerase beta' subunit